MYVGVCVCMCVCVCVCVCALVRLCERVRVHALRNRRLTPRNARVFEIHDKLTSVSCATGSMAAPCMRAFSPNARVLWRAPWSYDIMWSRSVYFAASMSWNSCS